MERWMDRGSLLTPITLDRLLPKHQESSRATHGRRGKKEVGEALKHEQR